MRLIMELADKANPFVENAEPWNLKKDPEKTQELQDVCTVALNLFRQLIIYLARWSCQNWQRKPGHC